MTSILLICFTIALMAACSDETDRVVSVFDGGHDFFHDPDGYQAVGTPWPELPLRPAVQTCAPGPVDFDLSPDLLATPTMENVEAIGIVALHQPSVTGDWWVAYADGRLGTVRTGPGATPFRTVMQFPEPILDVLLVPSVGQKELIYVSFKDGPKFKVRALTRDGSFGQSEEEVFIGTGDGRLTIDNAGALYATTDDGLVSIAEGQLILPGSNLGRCYFENGEPWCFGEQSLACETSEGLIFLGSDAPALWGARLYVCGRDVRARELINGMWVDRVVLTHGTIMGGLFTDRLGRLHGYDADGFIVRLRLAQPNYELGWPKRLSETLCLNIDAQPGPDLIPYRVNAPLWTDGAEKRRWFVIPPGSTIKTAEIAEWQLPVGSVVIKQFDLPDRDGVLHPIETRIMTRWFFGWSFHSYRWRDDGSDADLLDGTTSVYRTITTKGNTFEYLFPSRQACEACHRRQLASVLALTTSQLTAGPPGAGQLDRFLAAEIIDRVPEVSIIPDPMDTNLSLHQRARATLHAQCSHCHQPRGWVPPDLDLDLRWSTPWPETRLCGVVNQYASFAVQGSLRLRPGKPDDSTILTRQLVSGYGRMPFGSALTDPRALKILRPWITEMVDCSLPEK